MAEFLCSLSLFPLVLTFGAYQFALWLQKKGKSPILNPILVSSVLVILFLLVTGIPNETFQAGSKALTWLLTPATVCLALPLYKQVQTLKKSLPAILVGIAAGMLDGAGLSSLKGALMSSLRTKIGALLVMPAMRVIKKKLSASEHGGAVLLGVNRPVVKAHGNANAKAIASAVRVAAEFAESGVVEEIAAVTGKASEEAAE